MKVLKRQKDGATLYSISGLTEEEMAEITEGLFHGASHFEDSAGRLAAPDRKNYVLGGKGAEQYQEATERHTSMVKRLQAKAARLRSLADRLTR